MATVGQIVARFRQTFPDCPEGTGVELFNKVHRRLLQRCEVRNKRETLPALTQGTREYDLPAGTWRVHAAYLHTSATEYRELEATTTDWLDENEPGWRADVAQGVPQRFFVDSAVDGKGAKNVIGLVPTPSASTSSGYPRLDLYVTSFTEFISSDQAPTNLPNEDVYEYGMCFHWAARRQPELVALHKPLYDAAMEETVAFVKNQAQRLNTQVVQSAVRGSRVV